MSGPVDVLADLRGVVRIAKAASGGITGNQPRIERAEKAIAAVFALIEADREYDAAVSEHKEIIRRIDQQGWYEIQTDALREAGKRTVRAMSRRTSALASIGGAP